MTDYFDGWTWQTFDPDDPGGDGRWVPPPGWKAPDRKPVELTERQKKKAAFRKLMGWAPGEIPGLVPGEFPDHKRKRHEEMFQAQRAAKTAAARGGPKVEPINWGKVWREMWRGAPLPTALLLGLIALIVFGVIAAAFGLT